ncbi:amidohydrolase family protein [Maricaulis maris]|nr:amidohydrolase family protein [Maricaulis maris]
MLRMIALLASLAGWAGASAQPVADLSDRVRQHIRHDAPQIALVGVRLVDGSGDPARADQTVLIEDGRIRQVGPAADISVPDGFTVLDLAGHSVIPGLVGLHNHLHYPGTPASHHTAPHLYLAGGVTTLFSAGSAAPVAELNMARAVERGYGPGPDMRIAAPYVTGPDGNWVMAQPDTAEAAHRFVDYWTENGVAGFKLYRHVTPDIARAVITRAHAHGLPVTGHLCSLTYRQAAEMGIDRIEHGFLSMSDLVGDKPEGVCTATLASLETSDPDGEAIGAVIAALVDHDVTLTSTLAIIESHFAQRPQGDARSLTMLAPEARAAYDSRQDALAARLETTRFTPELFGRVLAFERRFVAAGGHLVAGPDTGRHIIPGHGDQRNVELLVEAGFTVEQAVRIATHNGAVELGLGTDRGLIRAGYRADLVVLQGDLSADISRIRHPQIVFRNGLGYDPESLAEAAVGQVGLR